MRNVHEQQEPTIIDDIGAIALLYAGVFRLIGRRLNPQSRQRLPALPDELLPPPLPVTHPGRRHEPAGAGRHG